MKINISMDSSKNYAEILLQERDMAVQKKNISIQSLSNIFQVREKQTYFYPGALFSSYQSNAIIPGLLYGEDFGDSSKGLFFLPTALHYLNFAGEQSVLPYPSLIFYLAESKGILKERLCFAVKAQNLKKLRMNTTLYTFPFGNVNRTDGMICWGTNKTSGYHGFKGLLSAIEIFFCSESNMDYIQKDSFKGYKSYRDLLQNLKSENEFPNTILTESPSFHTIEKLFYNYF